MAKKTIKKLKKVEPQTLNILPIHGFWGLIADITLFALLMSAAFSMLLLCVYMAEKITITVGK